jgi:hypothetical protein
MRVAPLLRPALCLLAALLLGACHGQDDAAQPGGSSPVAAVQTSLDLTRVGDFNALWKHLLPPADYAHLRADWNLHQRNLAPITAAERERFDRLMQQLTAPDAARQLYAQWQPKLAAMERQYGDQLPILIGVGEALAKRAVSRNGYLPATRKDQLNQALDALLPWAQHAPWFDRAKARQALQVATATARQLQLRSLDEARALDFDAVMGKYAVGYRSLKQVLAIYGLSLDEALASVTLSELSRDGDRAVVRIDYRLQGTALSTDIALVGSMAAGTARACWRTCAARTGNWPSRPSPGRPRPRAPWPARIEPRGRVE